MSEPKPKETFIVTFFPDRFAQGSPLRENLKVSSKSHMDGRLWNMAQKKGKKLKAGSWMIWKLAMPRVVPVDYDTACDECGQYVKDEEAK